MKARGPDVSQNAPESPQYDATSPGYPPDPDIRSLPGSISSNDLEDSPELPEPGEIQESDGNGEDVQAAAVKKMRTSHRSASNIKPTQILWHEQGKKGNFSMGVKDRSILTPEARASLAKTPNAELYFFGRVANNEAKSVRKTETSCVFDLTLEEDSQPPVEAFLTRCPVHTWTESPFMEPEDDTVARRNLRFTVEEKPGVGFPHVISGVDLYTLDKYPGTSKGFIEKIRRGDLVVIEATVSCYVPQQDKAKPIPPLTNRYRFKLKEIIWYSHGREDLASPENSPSKKRKMNNEFFETPRKKRGDYYEWQSSAISSP